MSYSLLKTATVRSLRSRTGPRSRLLSIVLPPVDATEAVSSFVKSLPSEHRIDSKGQFEIKECRLCSKGGFEKPDNCWKLSIRTDGSYYCYRCADTGTFELLQYKMSLPLASRKRVKNVPSEAMANLMSVSPRSLRSTDKIIERTSVGSNDQVLLAFEKAKKANYILPDQLESRKFHTDLFADTASNETGIIVSTTSTAESTAIQRDAADVFDYLCNVRCLRPEILLKYRVGMSRQAFVDQKGAWKEQLCVTFPWIKNPLRLDETNEVPQIVRVKYRALAHKGMQRILPKGGEWGFYGWHTVFKPSSGGTLSLVSDQIVITEGEYDCMSVAQAIATITDPAHPLANLQCISLPNGCNNLPLEMIPLLDSFKRIYLWMDNDESGQASVKKFSEKLGSHRCWVVTPRSGTGLGPKDANDALRWGMAAAADGSDSKYGFDRTNTELIINILMEAEQPRHERIEIFADRKDEVVRSIRSLGSSEDVREGAQTPSVPSLCTITKGFRRGELCVLTGPTGGGKTTLLAQLSLDFVKEGIPTLWGSFEIKNTRLMQKMLHQFYPGGALRTAEETVFNQVVDDFEALPLKFMNFHGSSNMDKVLEAMDFAVYCDDVQHIIVDNLQFMLPHIRTSDKFEAQDAAVTALRKFATEKNVNIILVVHPRKEDPLQAYTLSSFYGTGKVTQEADLVMIMQRKDINDITLLQVAKNRFDGQLGSIALKFAGYRSSFFEVPMPKPLPSNKSSYRNQQ